VVTDVSIPASSGRRISTGGSGRITCTGCFAPMPADAPKCLGCGKSNARAGVGVRRDSASGAPSGPKTPTASSIPPKTQTSAPTKTSPLKPTVPGPTPALTPTPPPSDRAFCPDCGASLPPGVKFCGECGMRF
jgi:predicted amidophosphoribosyltransferase